ncbi:MULTISPECIES: hypothetical protein [unclassified Ensifer]|nr:MULTISPECIES: hypothetical protein [unclassified Ensifer]
MHQNGNRFSGVCPASATFGCLSLLAYLDAVKRSRSLDTWFQLVIQD